MVICENILYVITIGFAIPFFLRTNAANKFEVSPADIVTFLLRIQIGIANVLLNRLEYFLCLPL